ncbi:hypothetical protein PG985_009753 [Apiospora marii]|uniref:uncharacterized protein n=1 Tax=Apiospora marii TaxID=335849 RepID=UPI00312D7954
MPKKPTPPSSNPVVGDMERLLVPIGQDVKDLKGRMSGLERSQQSTIANVDKGHDCIAKLHEMVQAERHSNAELDLGFENLKAEWDAERARNQRALEDAQNDIAAFRATAAENESRQTRIEAELAAMAKDRQADPYRQLAVIMACQRATKGQWDRVFQGLTGKQLSDAQWSQLFPGGSA